MLKRPDRRVITALADLMTNPNFKDVRNWLDESLQDLYTLATESPDDLQSKRAQGAAQAVREIVRYADEARDIAKKYQ